MERRGAWVVVRVFFDVMDGEKRTLREAEEGRGVGWVVFCFNPHVLKCCAWVALYIVIHTYTCKCI